MEPWLQAVGHTANFYNVAITILVGCLEKNGALLPGQFEDALPATVEHPQAERERLDYQMLAQLLKSLEGETEPLH